MSIRIAAACFISFFGLSVGSTQAGPCSAEIAQFELAVRQSAGNPNAGPMARQSIAAQIDRQPTPSSVKRAEQRAQAKFAATLARAKRLDARRKSRGMHTGTRGRQGNVQSVMIISA